MKAGKKLLTLLILFMVSGILYYSSDAAAQCGFNKHNDYICGGGTNTQPPPFHKGKVTKPPSNLSSSTFITSGTPISIGGGLCELPAGQIIINGISQLLPAGSVIECSKIQLMEDGQYITNSNAATAPPSGDFCGGQGATGSTPGEKIANAASSSIGASTANVQGTQGGNLGCAIAVSYILECAGYGVGRHLSTVALYEALDNDPCYQKVDTGSISDADLQPGDVLVTKRGSVAGHTGIYIGNGQIVSNSSASFQGSSPGTVQQNYSVASWGGVTSRNPGGSAVFRRTCP